MAREVIGLGTVANDGTGDPIRDAFTKANDNFLEVYSGLVPAPSFTVATVPSAAARARCMIFVSDESGGAVLAFSDGTSWRRLTDRAVVS